MSVAQVDETGGPSALTAVSHRVGRLLTGHPRPTVIGAAVLAVAAVVLAVLAWTGGGGNDRAEELAEAREAARISAVRLLSFGQTTLEKDLQSARSVVTGGLEDRFEEAVETPVREQFAATPGLESRITVEAAGASPGSGDDIRVIVFYNQINRLPDVPQAQTIRLAAVLTMQETGGEWRVSNLVQF